MFVGPGPVGVHQRAPAVALPQAECHLHVVGGLRRQDELAADVGADRGAAHQGHAALLELAPVRVLNLGAHRAPPNWRTSSSWKRIKVSAMTSMSRPRLYSSSVYSSMVFT